MKIHNASCLCRGIRFKIRGELRPVIYCHCSQCLKTHGHFA
ncbi:MAG: GFA family protein, partial [SAR324 cluster bacterium]|nr:GFA family protein [SAR324 cluster bacterium]